MRKSLKHEVSQQEMQYMRLEEGLSNKQIAERLGISVNTVYRYIGKRSYAVTNARAQNKPVPVPEVIATGRYEEEPTEEQEVIEEVAVGMEDQKPIISENHDIGGQAPFTVVKAEAPYIPTMPVLKERRIVEFQGDYCVFEVDTGDKSVTMKDGATSALVTGILDVDSLGYFIRELMQVHNMLKRS